MSIVDAQERLPGFLLLAPVCAEAGQLYTTVCEAILSTCSVHLDVLDERKSVRDPGGEPQPTQEEGPSTHNSAVPSHPPTTFEGRLSPIPSSF